MLPRYVPYINHGSLTAPTAQKPARARSDAKLPGLTERLHHLENASPHDPKRHYRVKPRASGDRRSYGLRPQTRTLRLAVTDDARS
jgi:hypothetical protein